MENQPIVATYRGDNLRKLDKILRVMSEYPEGITPKVIAYRTGLNVNTVKAILRKSDQFYCEIRGYYKVAKEGDTPLLENPKELTSWNFHNLILTTQLKDFKPISSKIYYGIVGLHYTISSTGKATIRLDCDVPLNVSSICMVFGYMKLLLSQYSTDNITEKDVYVSTIEFNKDYTNIRLDGVNSISVDSLTEHFKIYQKQLSTRIEHKTKVPFSVTTVVDMLKSNPNSMDIQVKLNEQREKLERLTSATVRNNQLLLSLMENQRK